MQQLGRLLRYPVKWLGGWIPFLGLLLLLVAVVIGLRWEGSRGAPVPPDAQNVASDINTGELRQTSYRVPLSIDDVRTFYRREMPARGWRYCGSQATPGCTNMPSAASEEVDVYRRADDPNNTGTTVEVWPVRTVDGLTYVSIFETGTP